MSSREHNTPSSILNGSPSLSLRSSNTRLRTPTQISAPQNIQPTTTKSIARKPVPLIPRDRSSSLSRPSALQDASTTSAEPFPATTPQSPVTPRREKTTNSQVLAPTASSRARSVSQSSTGDVRKADRKRPSLPVFVNGPARKPSITSPAKSVAVVGSAVTTVAPAARNSRVPAKQTSSSSLRSHIHSSIPSPKPRALPSEIIDRRSMPSNSTAKSSQQGTVLNGATVSTNSSPRMSKSSAPAPAQSLSQPKSTSSLTLANSPSMAPMTRNATTAADTSKRSSPATAEPGVPKPASPRSLRLPRIRPKASSAPSAPDTSLSTVSAATSPWQAGSAEAFQDVSISNAGIDGGDPTDRKKATPAPLPATSSSAAPSLVPEVKGGLQSERMRGTLSAGTRPTNGRALSDPDSSHVSPQPQSSRHPELYPISDAHPSTQSFAVPPPPTQPPRARHHDASHSRSHSGSELPYMLPSAGHIRTYDAVDLPSSSRRDQRRESATHMVDMKRLLSKPASLLSGGSLGIVSYDKSSLDKTKVERDRELQFGNSGWGRTQMPYSPSSATPESDEQRKERKRRERDWALGISTDGRKSKDKDSTVPTFIGSVATGTPVRTRHPPPPIEPSADQYSFLDLASPVVVGINESLLDLPSPPTRSSSSSPSPSPSPNPSKLNEKRPRNVLKRRPSAKNANTSAAPTLASLGLRPELTLSHSATTVASATSSSQTSRSRSQGRGASPKLAVLTDALEHSPSSPSGSGTLTPAGEVVMAYKQRNSLLETTRSDIEKGRGPTAAVESSSTLDVMNTHTKRHSEVSESDDVKPYYTVLGSSSGRVVAVGGPEDAWSHLSYGLPNIGFTRTRASQPPHSSIPTPTPKPKSPSAGLGKTLSRKISGRWRRADGGDDVVQSHEDFPRGRPSFQVSREGNYPYPVWPDPEKSPHMRKSSAPPPEALSHPYSEKDGDGLRNNVPRSRKSEPPGGNGSKIWKLMKRISTGGLRDKYHEDSSDSVSPLTPPPVPALPKAYERQVPKGPRSADGHGSSAERPLVGKFMQARPSLSYAREPLMASPKSSKTTGKSLPSPLHPNPSGPRPSTTTRSSSPYSSDVASSKFFHRTHSQRSSSSSLGEEIAAPPVPYFPKHIIAPSELNKLEATFPKVPSSPNSPTRAGNLQLNFINSGPPPSDEWMIIRSPEGPEPPRPSLQMSRRRDRSHDGGDQLRRLPPVEGDGRPPSPLFPEFSVEAPVNAFPARKSTSATSSPVNTVATGRSMIPKPVGARDRSPAPPRPARSTMRPSPATSQAGSRPGSPPDFPSSGPREHKRTSSTGTSRPRRSDSISRAASASVSSVPSTAMGTFGASSSYNPGRLTPPPTSQSMSFKDISDKSWKRQWSDQEKSAKWDALIEKSDRAGGTLHLTGDGGVLSRDI